MHSDLLCFVLSLERATQRRAQIASSLTQLGISFQFVNGFDARATDITAHPQVDASQLCATLGRKLTPGELAAALGHSLAYRALLESQAKFALILEDDAILKPDLVQFIRTKAYSRNPLMMLGHHYTHAYKGGAQRLFPGYQILRPSNLPVCTVGYTLDRATAATLLAANTPVHSVADWPVDVLQLNLRVISPPLVVHPVYLESMSMIGERPVEGPPSRNRQLKDYLSARYWQRKWTKLRTRKIS